VPAPRESVATRDCFNSPGRVLRSIGRTIRSIGSVLVIWAHGGGLEGAITSFSNSKGYACPGAGYKHVIHI
jgi:hypothetical protein